MPYADPEAERVYKREWQRWNRQTEQGRAVQVQNKRRRSDVQRVRDRERANEQYRHNREKGIARAYMNDAIKDGIIVRPRVCSLNEPVNEYHAGMIVGVIIDLNNPFEPVWMCKRCHFYSLQEVHEFSLVKRFFNFLRNLLQRLLSLTSIRGIS